MTICLGVLSPGDGAVVAVADRMVTGGPTTVEFEHEGSKIEHLTGNCVALTAGDALVSNPFFRRVRAKIKSLAGSTEEATGVDAIAGIVRDMFAEERMRRAELLHLKGRGTTLGEFYSRYVNEWPGALAQGIDGEIQKTEFGIDIVIAGVDSEPHLYSVSHPGELTAWDGLGFCAIGSGAPLASLECIASCSGPAKNMNLAVYVAGMAKLAAEAHPGVGKNTDMVIITKQGVNAIPDTVITKIRARMQRRKTLTSVPVLYEESQATGEIDG